MTVSWMDTHTQTQFSQRYTRLNVKFGKEHEGIKNNTGLEMFFSSGLFNVIE